MAITRLTPKEAAFAQAVAAGATLSDAYRASRDCTRMTTATINSNSKRLGRRPGVKARIEELRESRQESGMGPGRESEGPRASEPPPDQALKERNKVGRPSLYTEQLASEILNRLAAGEPLRTICRDNGMPDESTVRGWAIDSNHPFFARYAHAREIGFSSMADEILEIADDSRNDYVEKITKSGDVAKVVDEEAISRSRVRIAARQWMLAKAMPHTFGDRLEHSGHLKVEDVTPPQPRHPGKEAIERMLASYAEGMARHEERQRAGETPEQTKAREERDARERAEAEERKRKALADPEVEEHRKLLVGLGIDPAEAKRQAEFAATCALYLPEQDAQTRRRERVETIRRYWAVGKDLGE